MTAILNLKLSDIPWKQACLPPEKGEFGLRRTANVALPAFSASTYACADLLPKILKPAVVIQFSDSDQDIQCWIILTGVDPPAVHLKYLQKARDGPIIEKITDDLVATGAAQMMSTARLMATKTKEAGC